MASIKIENITKEYTLKRGKKCALKDISFSAKQGEFIGIIGRNGSGKSTLLKIISGVTSATSGKVQVMGRISALLELGAGFNPEYTGIENIYLNGSINGLTKKETEAKLPEILEFADIGDYAERPVKTYSDGMFVRLAFAAAVCTEPDVLIVDEALAVGDFLFRAKCYKKFQELKAKGITILYVTHDIDSVRKFCNRAIWLESGELILDGPVEEVTSAYMGKFVNDEIGLDADTKMLNRFGTDTGAIKSVESKKIWKMNEETEIKVSFKTPTGFEPENIGVSVSVKNKEGLDLFVMRSGQIDDLKKDGITEVIFRFKNILCAGEYFLSVGLERQRDFPITYYDYCDGIFEIKSMDDQENFGVFHAETVVEVHGRKT